MGQLPQGQLGWQSGCVRAVTVTVYTVMVLEV